jgi:hypothetical protein
VANALNLFRNVAVGFIDWLGLFTIAAALSNPSAAENLLVPIVAHDVE